MSELYCVFQTKEAADAALEVIYSHMVAEINSPDLLDVTTDQVVDKAELDEQERAQYGQDNRRFPVFGQNAATQVKEIDQGYTTAWSISQLTNQGLWVFQKPKDAWLIGVSGYTVEPYSPDWFA